MEALAQMSALNFKVEKAKTECRGTAHGTYTPLYLALQQLKPDEQLRFTCNGGAKPSSVRQNVLTAMRLLGCPVRTAIQGCDVIFQKR